jgi:hypothetical protein
VYLIKEAGRTNLFDNVLVAVVNTGDLTEGSERQVVVAGGALSSRIDTDVSSTGSPRTLQDSHGDVVVTGLQQGNSHTEAAGLAAHEGIGLTLQIGTGGVGWDGPVTVISEGNGCSVVKHLENITRTEAGSHLENSSLLIVQHKDLVSIGVLGTVGDSVPTGIGHHGNQDTVNAEQSAVAGGLIAVLIKDGEFEGVGVDGGGHVVLGKAFRQVRVEVLLDWQSSGQLGKEDSH